jgi:two-component sensor histidine kinase
VSDQSYITKSTEKPFNSLDELIKDDRFQNFVSIIHDFNVQISKANHPQDIYKAITLQLANRLNLSDCVIYEVDEQKKILEQVAAFGPKNVEGDPLKNKLILEFGQGHAGKAAKQKKSILVENCKESKDYVEDLEEAGSEIEVPIIHNDRVYAVISSESKEVGFYNDYHLKLFEILASITAGYISKLTEKAELRSVKLNLEEVLKKKSNDLEMVVESLSDHYTALKKSHEKREILLQEVHHRVNNNLQVISSIINLYGKLPNGNVDNALLEIHKRVQAMALIHQNFYKSFEQNLVNVKSYFNDLMNYLKSFNHQVVFSFRIHSKLDYITINHLVPIGLLVTEFVSKYLDISKDEKINNITLNIYLNKNMKSGIINLTIQDDLDKDISLKLSPSIDSTSETVSDVLTTALLDQLAGELKCYNKENNFVSIYFKEF